MTINERLFQVRTSLGKTQIEIAKAIGITQGTLSSIELGNTALTDRNVKQICKEFGVSEEWLRSGEGEMLNQKDLSFLELVLEKSDSLSDIEIKAITEFIKLPDGHRKIIMDFIKKMAD